MGPVLGRMLELAPLELEMLVRGMQARVREHKLELAEPELETPVRKIQAQGRLLVGVLVTLVQLVELGTAPVVVVVVMHVRRPLVLLRE